MPHTLAPLTLAIVKPDAFAAGNAGNVVAHLEREGFKVRGARVLHLSREQAQAFYEVHAQRPFYGSLVEFMTSGPCMPLALEREDAVPYLRQVMGATDPAKAEAGTLRKEFGEGIERNATHGSDAPETAAFELGYFFRGLELLSR